MAADPYGSMRAHSRWQGGGPPGRRTAGAHAGRADGHGTPQTTRSYSGGMSALRQKQAAMVGREFGAHVITGGAGAVTVPRTLFNPVPRVLGGCGLRQRLSGHYTK